MDLYKKAADRGTELRILLTRLRFLGDIVITTPVIEALRECFPDAVIYYMAQEEYASVLEGNPFLDGILSLRKGLIGTLSMIRRIRRMKFTAAIDLFYNPRSANLLFLSGIPVRIGGSRKSRKKLYTDNFSVPGSVRSAVEHHLSALSAISCKPGVSRIPRVYLQEEELEEGREIIKECTGLAAEEEKIVSIHPGGTWQAKRWPPDHFAGLIDRIKEGLGARSVLITGPGEEAIIGEVAGLCRHSPGIIPVLPVRKAGAVMKVSDLTVANDGGIMHLSVALRNPTVGIFGPTEPDIWFPYSHSGPFRLATMNLDCAPCHRHYCEHPECLTELPVERVFRKLLEVKAI